jgi:hypothetical protein
MQNRKKYGQKLKIEQVKNEIRKKKQKRDSI